MSQVSMNRRRWLAAAGLAGAAASVKPHRVAASVPQWRPRGFRTPVAAPMACHAFDLEDVQILSGPFYDNMMRDKAYLLSLDPNRLLVPFYNAAHIRTTYESYGGWERSGISGHICGHFMSAASMMYAATGDAQLKGRLDLIITELDRCQTKNGHGYLGSAPGGRAKFRRVLAGIIDVHRFSLDGGGSPFYLIHKIMAGLRDVWLHLHNPVARKCFIKMADWCSQFPARLTPAQMQKMLICESGGINEVLADVYRITGNRKYLRVAEAFNHRGILDPLMQGRDILNGWHSNSTIPKFVGLATQYECCGNESYRRGAEFFWSEVALKRSYVTGGNADYEHFYPIGETNVHINPNSAESCCTYNMLKLTNHMFCWNAEESVAAFYERALFNHILASQDPRTGMMCYYLSLGPGHFKTFSTPHNSMWCCVGTGMENHAKYGRGIYYHNGEKLWINLFIHSRVHWRSRGISILQETDFPRAGRVKFTFACAAPVRAVIHLRHPAWSIPSMRVAINRGRADPGPSGSFMQIDRIWKTGDTVEIDLSLPVRTEPMPHDENRFAILKGPIVLTGVLGDAQMAPPIPYAGDNQSEYCYLPNPLVVPSMIVGDRPVSDWVKAVPGRPLEFQTRDAGKPKDVHLRPLYEVNHERYTVYWRRERLSRWKREYPRRLAQAKLLAAIPRDTIDYFIHGDARSEAAHHLSDLVNSGSGFAAMGPWRDAVNGGGFSFRMKVLPRAPIRLDLVFWGGDDGAREFDILVDGEKIGYEVLHRDHPGTLFNRIIPIPSALTRGRTHVTVRLQARPGTMAGGLYGCRTLRTEHR